MGAVSGSSHHGLSAREEQDADSIECQGPRGPRNRITKRRSRISHQSPRASRWDGCGGGGWCIRSGCGATALEPLIARAQDVQSGGTLTYALSFDFDDTLDPQVTNYDSTIRVMLNVCEPLLWMPTATEFYPGLADSWEISDDGKTYTFNLKQGVTFTDGTPFNADAVKFTFDRVVEGRNRTAAGEEADPETVIVPGQSFNQVDAYDHAEVVDDHTIKLILSRPFAPLLSGLNGYLGIVSPTAVGRWGWRFGRKPVGTGPFIVQEWVAQDHVTLAKNPDYNWGSSFFKHAGAAYLDEMIYKIIPDEAVRTGTLISG